MRACIHAHLHIFRPYVESYAGASGPKTIYEGLSSSCSRGVGKDDYVWDYFNSILLTERYTCTNSKDLYTHVSGLKMRSKFPNIPFKHMNSDFHFRTDWYHLASNITINCMKRLTPPAEDGTWNATEIAAFNAELRPKMEKCFLNDKSWIKSPGLCNCMTKNVQWSTSQVSASEKREDRKIDIQEHALFGCWFASPTATAPTKATYDICTSVPSGPIHVGPSSESLLEIEARSAEKDGLISRKTALLTFFLFKEAGPLSCIAILFVLFIVALILYPILLLLVQIICAFHQKDEMMKLKVKAQAWTMAEHTWGEAVNVVWQLGVGMSNSYRGWITLHKVLFTNQINASLVKDGINKVTAVLNIMFGIMLNVLSDIEFSQTGWIWFSIMMSAFNVVLQSLMEKEKQNFMTSFFKDLNENRMSKFEIALGLVKCMEDFLEDDVSFNFVQHFYGDERVRPSELDVFEEREKSEPGSYDAEWSVYAEKEEHILSNGDVRDVMCCGAIQKNVKPTNTIFDFYPNIPKDLVDKFGHDNRFEFAPDAPTSNCDPQKPMNGGASASCVYAAAHQQAQFLKCVLGRDHIVMTYRDDIVIIL